MSNFNKAYDLLQKWENRKTKDGWIVYSNIKQDKGGETVFGIARNIHPNNAIWNYVDYIKKSYNEEMVKNGMSYSYYSTIYALELSKRIIQDERIQKLAKDFFRYNYWEKLYCQNCLDETFAQNLFLLGVNAGVKRAIKVGQQACNITVDGIIGNQTKEAFQKAGIEEAKKFTEIEIEYYKSLVKKNSSQQIFLQGWLNRANAV